MSGDRVTLFPLDFDSLSLTDHKNPCQLLLSQLQECWDEAEKSRDKVRSEQYRIMWERANPTLTELLDVPCENDNESFSKIVNLCILLSGLGSIRCEEDLKETRPALQSVIKPGDIRRLTDLSRTDREQHLLELVQIVMGIRLFNKDCKKGGGTIDDLPLILTNAVTTMKEEWASTLSRIRDIAQQLIMYLNVSYNLPGKYDLKRPILPKGITLDYLEEVKIQLCLTWQLNSCLSELHQQMVLAEVHVKTCVEQLQTTLLSLHDTVRYRAAIPTVQVYPLFVQLSIVWRELQYEAAAVSNFSCLLNLLTILTMKNEEYAAKNKELEMRAGWMGIKDMGLPSILESKDLDFEGFCPWTFLQTSGGLIPGQYLQDGYAFRSQQAASAWFDDANKSNKQLQELLLQHKELAYFLKMVDTEADAAKEDIQLRETSEKAIQTEVHPIESYIDHGYVWSQWQLKKRAVNLAKLTKCLTRSQQTTYTAFKKDKICQRFDPKDVATQILFPIVDSQEGKL